MSGVNSLPSLILLSIFSRLNFRDCSSLQCVQRSWRILAGDDLLWQNLFKRDWNWNEALDSLDDSGFHATFKDLYARYHKDFGRYGKLYSKAKFFWDTLKSWSNERMPEVASSINPGISESDIDKFEASLGLDLPPSMRVLYRLHDGQSMPNKNSDGSSLFSGLLGGYSFYNHLVNVRLLSLDASLDYTRHIIPNISHPPGSRLIVIGASFNLLKLVFLDCTSGMVYIGGESIERGELIPAAPSSRSIGAADEDESDAFTCGNLLWWLEEYAQRLRGGMYSVRKLLDTPLSKAICLFPESGADYTSQVTNRVKVSASAIFVPEASDLPTSRNARLLFSYSIRMSLLPAESGVDSSFSTVQLFYRHWYIRENDTVSEVHGEAVIGKYPILTEGGDEFVYQSCSEMMAHNGSIEGRFTFVPGTLQNPSGEPFDVFVAKFPLNLPKFVY